MAVSSHACGRLLVTRRRCRLRKLWFEPLESRRLLAAAEIVVFDRAPEHPRRGHGGLRRRTAQPMAGNRKTFTIRIRQREPRLTLPTTMPPAFFITPPNAGQFSYTVQAGQQLTFSVSMRDSVER